MTIRWSQMLDSLTSTPSTYKWRPYQVDLVAALTFLLGPSGFVPGSGKDGQSASSQSAGGSSGLECVFHFNLRVFLVRCRDYVVIVLLVRVLAENCICTDVF